MCSGLILCCWKEVVLCQVNVNVSVDELMCAFVWVVMVLRTQDVPAAVTPTAGKQSAEVVVDLCHNMPRSIVAVAGYGSLSQRQMVSNVVSCQRLQLVTSRHVLCVFVCLRVCVYVCVCMGRVMARGAGNFEASIAYLKAHVGDVPAVSLAVQLMYNGLTGQPDEALLHTAQVAAAFPHGFTVDDLAAVVGAAPAGVDAYLTALDKDWRLITTHSNGVRAYVRGAVLALWLWCFVR